MELSWTSGFGLQASARSSSSLCQPIFASSKRVHQFLCSAIWRLPPGNALNVSLVSQAGVCRSVHLSGIAQGFTHRDAFARVISAVAEALISLVGVPNADAMW